MSTSKILTKLVWDLNRSQSEVKKAQERLVKVFATPVDSDQLPRCSTDLRELQFHSRYLVHLTKLKAELEEAFEKAKDASFEEDMCKVCKRWLCGVNNRIWGYVRAGQNSCAFRAAFEQADREAMVELANFLNRVLDQD